MNLDKVVEAIEKLPDVDGTFPDIPTKLFGQDDVVIEVADLKALAAEYVRLRDERTLFGGDNESKGHTHVTAAFAALQRSVEETDA